MALISDGTLARVRRFKESGYSDTALRLVHTPADGEYNYGKPTYPEGDSFDCRFKPRSAPDLLPGTNVPMVDADLYFSPDETLGSHDRVTITHLHGEEVESPQTYEITAGPVLSSTGQRAMLKLVTE